MNRITRADIDALTPEQKAYAKQLFTTHGKEIAQHYIRVLQSPPATAVERKKQPRPTGQRAAKCQHLVNGITQERAFAILYQAKPPLRMVEINNRLFLSSGQVAKYYQVELSTIRGFVNRERPKLEEDGLCRLDSETLDPFRKEFNIPLHIPSLIAWSPCAILRAGLMLRDSDVAKKVRSILETTPLKKQRG